MILVRILLALPAIPLTLIWLMLTPGGRPSGIPLPWGIVAYLMIVLLPLTAILQIMSGSLTKLYLLLLIGPILLWMVASQLLNLLYF